MEQAQAVDSLVHFKENTQEIIERLKVSGHPLVLTVDREAESVVLAEKSYRRMLALLDRAEAIEGIQRGLALYGARRRRPAVEVFEGITHGSVGPPRQCSLCARSVEAPVLLDQYGT